MISKFYLIIFSFLFVNLNLHSQVVIVWDTIKHAKADWYKEVKPSNYQLFPRDLNDRAIVKFSGKAESYPTIESGIVRLRLVKKYSSENDLKSNTSLSKKESIAYNSDTCYTDFPVVNGHFNFYTHITSGFINYFFDFMFYRDSLPISDWIKVADSVVCGDVFVVMGQSNAEAESEHSETGLLKLDTIYGNSFCRTYGRPPKFKMTPVPDNHYRFGISRVSRKYSDHPDHRLFNVGVWELYLQGQISFSFGVPTCILNGGRGGTSIQENLPQDRPYEKDSLFGNMNYRIYQAGYSNNIKGFIWYQGETDVFLNTTREAYLSSFRNLYEETRIHFGDIDKYYIFQIHASDTSGNNINEALRILPSFYPDMEIMSTNGVGNRVGIHYDSTGYRKIGDRLLRLLERDWYCKADEDIIGIEPPNLKYVYLSEDEQSLSIEFNQEVNFDSLARFNINGIIESFSINGIVLNSNLVNIILPGENGNSNNKIIINSLTENWLNIGLPVKLSYMKVQLNNSNSYFLRNSKEVACLNFAINHIPYWSMNSFTENYLNNPFPPYSDFVEHSSGRMTGIQHIDIKSYEVFNDGYTVVPSNSQILIKAANKIILSPGFSTEMGSSCSFAVGHDLYAYTRDNNCDLHIDISNDCIQYQSFINNRLYDSIQKSEYNASFFNNEAKFYIFPNPSCQYTGINWISTSYVTDLSVELLDISGNIVRSYSSSFLQPGQFIKMYALMPGLHIVKSTFVLLGHTYICYDKIIIY